MSPVSMISAELPATRAPVSGGPIRSFAVKLRNCDALRHASRDKHGSAA